LFSRWLEFEEAVVLAYLVGMIVAFILMRVHVFSPSGQAFRFELAKFVAVNCLAIVQTFVVSVALARWILPAWGMRDHVDAVAHLTGVIFPVVTSYFCHKHVTFR
jgi:putative flippase GtrA